MSAGNSFFGASTDQSRVKATIVSKYFFAWAKVIIPRVRNRGRKIAYVDLYAGRGRYEDGTPSTPLLILERAISDPDLRGMLVSIFNEKDSDSSEALMAAIRGLSNVGTLKYHPTVWSDETGESFTRMFSEMRMVPTLLFLDPWGYKGLSLDLVNSVIKDWGCECVLFFNYNRINMHLSIKSVQQHMNKLFGEERAVALRARMDGLEPRERERVIVNEFIDALKDIHGQYVLPFAFKQEHEARTSHYIIFVSKHFRGYEIMKNIMAKQSSSHVQGVPSFEYKPEAATQLTLFELARPLDDLERSVPEELAGETLKMVEVYERHSIGKPYVKKNYKTVLSKLEEAGKISADPPASERRRGTFAEHVVVHFPGERRRR